MPPSPAGALAPGLQMHSTHIHEPFSVARGSALASDFSERYTPFEKPINWDSILVVRLRGADDAAMPTEFQGAESWQASRPGGYWRAHENWAQRYTRRPDQPQPEDRFEGATFLQTVPSNVAPPTSDSGISGGYHPRKDDTKPRPKPSESRKQAKEVMPDFPTVFDRALYFEQRAKAAAAGAPFEYHARDKTAPHIEPNVPELPDPVDDSVKTRPSTILPAVKLEICHGTNPTQRHPPCADIRSHVDLIVTFGTPGDMCEHRTRVLLRMDRENLASPIRYRQVEGHADLDAQIYGEVQQDRFHPDAWQDSMMEVVVRYNAQVVQGYNVLTPVDFGVWQAWMAKFQSFVAHGAEFRMVLPYASELGTHLDAINAELEADWILDPIGLHWRGEHRHLRIAEENLSALWDEDRHIRPTTVSYRDLIEAYTVELDGNRHEHAYEKRVSGSSVEEVEVRYMRVPLHDAATRECALMLIMNFPQSAAKLREGEVVRVRSRALNPNDSADCCWKGEVYAPLPHFAVDVQTVMLHRRLDDLYQPEFAKIDPEKPLPDYMTAENAQALADIVEAAPSDTVDITVELDDAAFRRRKNLVVNLSHQVQQECMHQASARGESTVDVTLDISATAELVLANRFDRLPVLRLTDVIPQSELDRAGFEIGPGPQNDAFVSIAERMLGGLAVLHGCPGSGKTKVLIAVVAAYVRSLGGGTGPRPGAQALVVSPANTHADSLVEKLLLATGEDAIIIRKYSQQTGKSIFDDLDPDASDADLDYATTAALDFVLDSTAKPSTTMADTIHEAIAASSKTVVPFDSRVTERGFYFSQGYWLAMVLGLREPSNANGHKHAGVARARALFTPEEVQNLTERLRRREDIRSKAELDEDDQTFLHTLGMDLRQALAKMYTAADAFVMTAQQAMDPSAFAMITPRIFIGDEWAKLESIESLAFTLYPSCHHRILAGDERQTRPQARTPAAYNPYTGQGTTSIFTRLIAAGFPTASIRAQKRYAPEIARLISGTFYEGTVYTDPTRVENLEDARFRAAAKAIFDVESNAVLIRVADTESRTLNVTSSKINHHTARVTQDLVERFILKGYAYEDLAVVTPYTGQRGLHETMHLARMATVTKEKVMPRLLIQSSERAIGQERRIVFFDVVAADKLGFVSESTRLCTSLSRSQHGLVVIADVKQLETAKGFQSKTLAKVFNHLTRLGFVWDYPKVENSEETDGDGGSGLDGAEVEDKSGEDSSAKTVDEGGSDWKDVPQGSW